MFVKRSLEEDGKHITLISISKQKKHKKTLRTQSSSLSAPLVPTVKSITKLRCGEKFRSPAFNPDGCMRSGSVHPYIASFETL